MNNLKCNEVISASAGTGKTYQLVNRYIKLLAVGAKPESIIALTFTKNAAGEIFDRIINEIISSIENFEKTKTNFNMFASKSSKDVFNILRSVVQNMHKLQIGTFDSFFVKIIKLFAFELGLPSDVDIINERMTEKIRENVLKKILWNVGTEKARRDFLEEFKKATLGREEKRFFDMFHNFVKQYHSLYLVAPDENKWGQETTIWPQGKFLRNNADNIPELAKELKKLIGMNENLKEKQKLKILEFIDMLSGFKYENKIPKELNTVLSNFLVAFLDIENGSAVLNVEGAKFKIPNEECEKFSILLRNFAKIAIDAKLNETRGIYGLLKKYEESYNKIIRSVGFITFADIPFILSPDEINARSYTLSSEFSTETNRLYMDYRLDSRFDHWLIDEFQDTSSTQWDIIKNLIDEIMQDSSGKRSFFYVGDRKQAIYGWRGGQVDMFNAIFHTYEKEFANISWRELNKSFRSSLQVIETVNRTFGKLEQIEALSDTVKSRWKWQQHIPKEKNKDGSPAKNGYAAFLQMKQRDENETKDKVFDIKNKAKLIIEKIQKISPLKKGLSVAILVGKNDTGTVIAEELQSAGIKTALEGHFRLTDNPVIPAFLSLIKFAAHPGDNFAWQHLLMTAFSELLTVDKESLCASVLTTIYEAGFEKTIEIWREKLKNEAGVDFDEFSTRRLDQFITAARLFDVLGEKNCIEFISYIENYEIPGEKVDDAIQIMTIHKAKGLQFDIVFMPELSRQTSSIKADLTGIQLKLDRQTLRPEWLIFLPKRDIAVLDPTLKNLIVELDEQASYESLCVLYVGMTRASEALYMIADPPIKGESKLFHIQDILLKTLAEGRKSQKTTEKYEILYECGEESCFDTYELRKEVLVPEKRRIIQLNYSKKLESKSPSKYNSEESSLGSMFSLNRNYSRELGLALHSLFEKIEWIEDCKLENILDEYRSEKRFSTQIENEAIEIFLKTIESCEIRNALSRPVGICELWREKQFELILNGEWISGQFDRVVIIKDKSGKPSCATILDFKSDKLKSQKEIIDEVEEHRPQLLLYKKSLASLIKIPESQISLQLALIRNGSLQIL